MIPTNGSTPIGDKSAGGSAARYTRGIMHKKDFHFDKVLEYKDRFRNLSLDQLRKKQTTGYRLIKEAAIAVRELIEEKEEGKDESTGF